jgi:hypothetical protein
MRRKFNVIEANTHTSKPSISARASAPREAIDSVQALWAEALRCDFRQDREVLLCKLSENVQELRNNFPNDPKVLLWNGIVLAGYAKCLGGLAGIHFQKLAKTSLEHAITMAPRDGAAYLYLGLLYDRAPEAPYGFGDEAMAKVLLEEGMALTLNTAKQIRQA